MEHYPLPTNPTIKQLSIPFLCTEQYDGGNFLSYPDRHGWKIAFHYEHTCILRDGVVVTSDEAGAFLQTWLIFGLLWEVTGEDPDMASFQRHESGAKYFCTTRLPNLICKWSDNINNQNWYNDTAQLDRKVEAVHPCLRLCSNAVLDIKHSTAYRGLNLVMLGIFAVLETLDVAFSSAIRYKSIDRTDGLGVTRLAYRIFFSEAPATDIASPLFEKMQENGWCPSKLADLDATLSMGLGACWFMANLSPPRSIQDHSRCSTESCASFEVNGGDYQTQHHRSGCSCSHVGPDQDCLASIIEKDLLPLVRVNEAQSGDSQEIVVHLESLENLGNPNFVAISHVWSDGHGNPFENTLPPCFLKDLQSMVDALPKEKPNGRTPFWIDTLCVPRGPVTLRKKAMVRLREPYENATHVLVLDSYLRSLDSDSMTTTELVARVFASKWVERLWTFQEGRLGKRIWFQFRDRALELSENIVLWYRRKHDTTPSFLRDGLEREIIASYNASHVHVWPKDEWDSIANIRNGLCTRYTSDAEDEALCLASLFDLDMKKVLEGPAPRRMETFWTLLPNVPPALVFSEVTHKLETPGFRWAPATFMGKLGDADWAGGAQPLDDFDRCTVTDQGIIINVTAVVINSSDIFSLGGALPPGISLLFHRVADQNKILLVVDSAGRWYRCYKRANWHQSPTKLCDVQQQRFAIIPRESWDPEKLSVTRRGNFDTGKGMPGILVTYNATDTSAEAMPVFAKAHSHVHISLMARNESELYNGFRECADRFRRLYLEPGQATKELDTTDALSGPPDADALRCLIDTYLFQHVNRFLLDRPELLELDREILERQGLHGIEWNKEDGVEFAVNWVSRLIQGLAGLVIETIPKKAWCID